MVPGVWRECLDLAPTRLYFSPRDPGGFQLRFGHFTGYEPSLVEGNKAKFWVIWCSYLKTPWVRLRENKGSFLISIRRKLEPFLTTSDLRVLVKWKEMIHGYIGVT